MRFKKSRENKRNRNIRKGTVGVKGVIETVLNQRGWTDKFRERKIFDSWKLIVGATIASQSMPVFLSRSVLLVEVTHSSCANELSAMKTDILTKLEEIIENLNVGTRKSEKIPKITDIRFHLNPRLSKVKSTENTTNSNTSESERVYKPIPSEVNERIEAVVSVINDNELRDALKTLFLTQCSYKDTTE